jgi:hypothetical protein
MASIVENLIQISGLADDLPQNPTAFKQFTLQETLTVPAVKPDIEQIVKVVAEVVIISTKVIRTPQGVSLEGQNLTGLKLIIEGEVRQKIEYVACEPTQSVHAVHFDIPFSAFIVLPLGFPIGTPITVTGYLEDIYVEMLDCRTIFKNVTILLDAEF